MAVGEPRNHARETTPAHDAVLGVLAHSLRRATGADVVIVSRWDADGSRALPAAHAIVEGIEAGTLLNPFSLEPESTAVAALRGRRPVAATADQAHGGLSARWPAALGWEAHLTLPMYFAQELFALVELGSKATTHRFTPWDIETCQAMVEQAALGIQQIFHPEAIRLASGLPGHVAAAAARAQIHAAQQERLQIASVLGTISASIESDEGPFATYELILREAATLIPYDAASITLFEDGKVATVAEAGGAFRELPAGAAVARFWRDRRNLDLAACSQEPLLAQFLAHAETQDLLSLPLLVNGTVVGRLTFFSGHAGRYETHQAQLAALLAERTAQVVRICAMRTEQEAALTKLTQLNVLRQDFVAIVSHELRTPLTGILGYLELLISRWNALDDCRRRKMLERAQSSAARLEHLVTDLLLFSNVEHHELQLQIVALPFTELVEQAVGDIATKYRGQMVEVRPAERPALVLADAQRATQVMVNLLDNAIKYSSDGTPVHLRWTVRRDEVQVSVRDRGPGIQPEDIPRLFTRFGTLGHQPRPGQVGTGIGLYICKRLLEAMGGRIWVTSRPGYGSTFHFTLPRAAGQTGISVAGRRED